MYSFCNAAVYETRVLLILYRLERPGRSVLGGNVVLLMRSPMSCFAYSFFGFVVITNHFPEIDERYFFSMLVTEGRFSSISFNPEYIMSSSIWCYG